METVDIAATSGQLPGVALMLHSHPELVHLGEVQKDKVDRVVYVSVLPVGTEKRRLVID